MRRALLLLASGALALSAGTGTASADTPTICVGELCVCVSSTGCFRPPAGETCYSIDLDDNGTAERVCLPTWAS